LDHEVPFPWTVKRFVFSPDRPLGLVTTISHGPTVVLLGISNVQVTLDDEYKLIVVAVILVAPEWRRLAVRLFKKSDPVISVVTEVPASPSSGSIPLIEGRSWEIVVVVVPAVPVAVAVLVAAVVTAVVTMVGAPVDTDATVTCVIFTVYTLSSIARFDVSVAGLVRYP
jgi:hypothetical protein